MNNKKYKIIIALLLAVSIFSSILCVKFYTQMKENQLKTAQYNFNEWYYLYRMTQRIDKEFVKNENWKESDLVLYENSIIYHIDKIIEPDIGPAPKTYGILMTYDELFKELIEPTFTETSQKETFQLFADMNTELLDICTYVFEKCANNKDMMVELITEDSELYKQVSEDLYTFCQKYDELCYNFWNKPE